MAHETTKWEDVRLQRAARLRVHEMIASTPHGHTTPRLKFAELSTNTYVTILPRGCFSAWSLRRQRTWLQLL